MTLRFIHTCNLFPTQDPAAIAALRRAVKLDPADTGALINLAVSYTNESYQAQACAALKDWIAANPAYRDGRKESLFARPETFDIWQILELLIFSRSLKYCN